MQEGYERMKGFAQMNPPIRDAHHRAALWRGMALGVAEGAFDLAREYMTVREQFGQKLAEGEPQAVMNDGEVRRVYMVLEA